MLHPHEYINKIIVRNDDNNVDMLEKRAIMQWYDSHSISYIEPNNSKTRTPKPYNPVKPTSVWLIIKKRYRPGVQSKLYMNPLPFINAELTWEWIFVQWN